jgi:hypothetical protein
MRKIERFIQRIPMCLNSWHKVMNVGIVVEVDEYL